MQTPVRALTKGISFTFLTAGDVTGELKVKGHVIQISMLPFKAELPQLKPTCTRRYRRRAPAHCVLALPGSAQGVEATLLGF